MDLYLSYRCPLPLLAKEMLLRVRTEEEEPMRDFAEVLKQQVDGTEMEYFG